MWKNIFWADAEGRPLRGVAIRRHNAVIRRCEPLIGPLVNLYQIDGRIAQLPGNERGIGPLIDVFGRTDLQNFPLGQNGDAIPH